MEDQMRSLMEVLVLWIVVIGSFFGFKDLMPPDELVLAVFSVLAVTVGVLGVLDTVWPRRRHTQHHSSWNR